MGAGVMGLCLAWELTRRGAEVELCDSAGPGTGASMGLVGALAPHAPDNWNEAKALQLEALLLAAPFWAEVAQGFGAGVGFARLGRVQPLADQAALDRAQVRADEARRNWGPGFVWQLRRAEAVPGLRLACDWVVHDTLTARITPRRAIAALLAKLGSRGVYARIAPAPSDGADRVVWATGAAGLISAGLGGGQKGQAAVLLAPEWRNAPQISAPGLHIVPHEDGNVAIGSTSERAFDDPKSTDALLEAVIDRARGLCPELAAAPVIARWAGLRPRAASRQPVLGPLADGDFIMNGGFKTGFAMAPLMASMLADLLLDGTDRIPAAWRPPLQA